MSIFSKFKMITVNEGINRVRTEKNAVMIDIRPSEEYKKGFISGSINIPMEKLHLVKNRVADTSTTIYVVGTYEKHPRKAARALRKMGYKRVIPSGVFEEHYGLLKKK